MYPWIFDMINAWMGEWLNVDALCRSVFEISQLNRGRIERIIKQWENLNENTVSSDFFWHFSWWCRESIALFAHHRLKVVCVCVHKSSSIHLLWFNPSRWFGQHKSTKDSTLICAIFAESNSRWRCASLIRYLQRVSDESLYSRDHWKMENWVTVGDALFHFCFD